MMSRGKQSVITQVAGVVKIINNKLDQLFISFPYIYVWDLGVRFVEFLLESCNPNIVQNDKFSGYTPIFPKSKSKKLF
jgi:hypothetical protein